MVVYIGGFFISTSLLLLSEKIVKKEKWIFVFIALLIPCCIAGLRADTIGTDVKVYLSRITNAAINSESFKEYLETNWYYIWRDVYVSDYEIGFVILVYGIGKLFRSLLAVQLAVQAFTIFPMYLALKQLENKYPLWLGMLTYYLIFFNTTLNLMRQSIAMAFLFLGFTYLINDKNKKFVLCLLIAVMFHTSSLIGVLIFAIYRCVGLETKTMRIGRVTLQRQFVNMVAFIGIGILSLLCNGIIVKVCSLFGMSKYNAYINDAVRFMPNQLISRLPVFLLFIYSWKKVDSKEKNFKFFFVMLCFDLLCSQFSSVNSFGGRIGMYFSEFSLISYPSIYMGMKRNKTILFILIAYMAFYWWFYFVYSGMNSTVPYALGI